MYEDPEHEDYDDDEYNYYPEYNNYGYPKEFSVDWIAWEKWLSDAIKDIVEEDNNVWSFNTKIPNLNKKNNKKTLSDKYFMYLGTNINDQSIWKTKYFIVNELNQMYKNHVSSHAAHFLKQPTYYRGMFDNLN